MKKNQTGVNQLRAHLNRADTAESDQDATAAYADAIAAADELRSESAADRRAVVRAWRQSR